MAAWGPLKLRAAGSKPAKPKSCRCRLNRPERLESRLLMTANPSSGDGGGWVHSAGVCSCPVCTGIGLDQVPTAIVASADPAASNPLSSLPQLSSNPNATAKLYLDFNGHFQSSWGSWSNATTPVYDQDGDATTFSSGELASIYDIWARVAEDFAPFNINVTTIDPGSLANQVVAHIAIGGSSSDWFGSSAGGVAYVGGFYNSAPNVGYVFENELGNGHAKYVAEAASHEAGHLFGLQHQSTWSGGTLTESYNSGNGTWAPIMGVGYYAPRTTWHNGPTSAGPSAYQDDLSILTNSSNGFGYRADDFGSTRATASTLAVSGTSVNFSGLIGRADDVDVWSFTTGGGAASFQLAVAASGSNLDSVLEIWDANGNVLASNSPSGAQGASVSATLGAGTFYVVARGLGDYGNMGQYTLTGSVPGAVTAPEIAVSQGGAGLSSGDTLSFGTTNVGGSVTRTVTVTNQGNAPLTLSSLVGTLPSGFTLVADLGSTTLGSGQSTTFTVQLDAASAGAFSGTLNILSNDGDEGQFSLTLSGSVAAPAPEIAVSNGGASLFSGDTLSFGSTTVGTIVTRTVTVTNQGSAPLTLSSLAGTLPSGFTLVTDLGSTTLAAGQSTTFTVQLDATSTGAFSGTLNILSNDSDEGQFSLTLSGSVAVPEQPVIRIADNGDAGNSRSGSWTRITGKGYGNDIDSAPRGNGSIVSNWTFSALPAGQYRVYATWTTSKSNASNAPFTLLDGGTTRASVRVSQRVAPNSLTVDGAKWKLLGTVTVSSGQLVVRLTNSANGSVVADAVRIEKVLGTGAPTAAPVVRGPGLESVLVAESRASALHLTAANALDTALPGGGASTAAPAASAAAWLDQNRTAHRAADIAPEQRALRDVLDLLVEVRKFTSHQSAVDQLAGDAQALSELLTPLA